MSVKKLVAVAGIISAAWCTHASAEEKTKISLILNFSPYGLHVGPTVAKDRGLYEAEGLDVEIIRGTGSGDAIKQVALGNVTFGLADASAVAFGRNQGLEVRQVSGLLNESGFAIYYRQNDGIATPKDLEGRTLGASADQAVFKLFPIYASAANIDYDAIEFVNLSIPTVIPSFVGKKIDTMITIMTEEPNVASAASKAGIEWDKFLYKDVGIDTYSIGIIAQDSRIADDSDLVCKFVRATMAGYLNAVQEPEAAVVSFTKYFPENDADLTLEQWRTAMPLIDTAETKEHGLGYISKEKMAATVDIVKQYADIGDIEATDIYTDICMN